MGRQVLDAVLQVKRLLWVAEAMEIFGTVGVITILPSGLLVRARSDMYFSFPYFTVTAQWFDSFASVQEGLSVVIEVNLLRLIEVLYQVERRYGDHACVLMRVVLENNAIEGPHRLLLDFFYKGRELNSSTLVINRTIPFDTKIYAQQEQDQITRSFHVTIPTTDFRNLIRKAAKYNTPIHFAIKFSEVKVSIGPEEHVVRTDRWRVQNIPSQETIIRELRFSWDKWGKYFRVQCSAAKTVSIRDGLPLTNGRLQPSLLIVYDDFAFLTIPLPREFLVIDRAGVF